MRMVAWAAIKEELPSTLVPWRNIRWLVVYNLCLCLQYEEILSVWTEELEPQSCTRMVMHLVSNIKADAGNNTIHRERFMEVQLYDVLVLRVVDAIDGSRIAEEILLCGLYV